MWVLNVALVILGFVFLDRKAMIWSSFASIALSAYVSLFEWIFPVTQSITGDLTLDVCFAAVSYTHLDVYKRQNLASAIAAYYVIAPCEAFSNLARFDGVRYGYQEQGCASLAEQTSLSRAHGFGEEAKRRQMLGAYLLSSGTYDKYYYPAQQVRTLITQDLSLIHI